MDVEELRNYIARLNNEAHEAHKEKVAADERFAAARALAEDWIHACGEGGPDEWEVLGRAGRDLLDVLDKGAAAEPLSPHTFVGTESDCGLCGEGIVHYIHTAPE